MNDEFFNNLEIKNENEILLIKEFFNEIIKRLIEILKDKKGIVNIIRQIIENSDINNLLDYLSTNFANLLLFVLNSDNENLDNMKEEIFNQSNEIFFKKLIDNNNNNNIINNELVDLNNKDKRNIKNKIDNKYKNDNKKNIKQINELREQKRIKNKIIRETNKLKLSQRFQIVPNKSGRDNFLLPNDPENFRYAYNYSTLNYVYLNCTDKNCGGKIKINKNSLKHYFIKEHSIPYEKHFYYM